LKGLEIQRTQDQLAYNRAQTKYNDLLEPPDPTDVAVAETEYQSAQAALSQAERVLKRIQDGPDSGDVAVLEAQIEKGYRDYETYSAGPDPDDVVLAEARVANAEAQLVAAQEILADLELTAPFEGIISEVYINPSEWVAPGSPVLLLANLEGLQVKTTDLSEIDVAKIKVGDTAIVSFDAFPDLTVEGTVIRIAPKADTSAGINYPVTLELDEIPPELRWGMTAFVDFELE
jgi:HlyD family secretion protein